MSRLRSLLLLLLISESWLISYAQQQYSCNGILYSYPHPSCTYNNNGLYNNGLNNGLNGNNFGSQVQYLCNGQYTSYPNPACFYNTGGTGTGLNGLTGTPGLLGSGLTGTTGLMGNGVYQTTGTVTLGANTGTYGGQSVSFNGQLTPNGRKRRDVKR